MEETIKVLLENLGFDPLFILVFSIVVIFLRDLWRKRRSVRIEKANQAFIDALIYLIIDRKVLTTEKMHWLKNGFVQYYHIEHNELISIDFAIEQAYSKVLSSEQYSNDLKSKFIQHQNLIPCIKAYDYQEPASHSSFKQTFQDFILEVHSFYLFFSLIFIVKMGYNFFFDKSTFLSKFIFYEIFLTLIVLFIISLFSIFISTVLLRLIKKILHIF